MAHMSSILLGDTMVPIIELSKILPSLWGIFCYVRKIILLGSTTKTNATHMHLYI